MRNLKLDAAIAIASLMMILGSCHSQNESNAYRVVYRNGKDGSALYGSKQELIQQIRGGGRR